MRGPGAKSHLWLAHKNLRARSRIRRRETRNRVGLATAATNCCEGCLTTSYLPGQNETICLILDFAVFRSAEVSSQIAVLSFSLLRISYLVGSMVRLANQITGHVLVTIDSILYKL
jgi:hypothetical protein